MKKLAPGADIVQSPPRTISRRASFMGLRPPRHQHHFRANSTKTTDLDSHKSPLQLGQLELLCCAMKKPPQSARGTARPENAILIPCGSNDGAYIATCAARGLSLGTYTADRSISFREHVCRTRRPERAVPAEPEQISFVSSMLKRINN